MTMYVILWRFRPLEGQESEFERAYGPSGEWALLFGRGDGYLGTELLRRFEDSREYLTLDRWVSRAAYETFHSRFSSVKQQPKPAQKQRLADDSRQYRYVHGVANVAVHPPTTRCSGAAIGAGVPKPSTTKRAL
jgi:heme-degrading monooxygenase HmoA